MNDELQKAAECEYIRSELEAFFNSRVPWGLKILIGILLLYAGLSCAIMDKFSNAFKWLKRKIKHD